MQLYGLIGKTLGHSWSRNYFREKFSEAGTDADYLNFELSDISEFNDLTEKHPDLVGVNVTLPYKQAILPYLNDIDDTAREIGAVNVVRIRDLKGFNTDVIGFVESLKPMLRDEHNIKALILGTGGVSKAVAFGLKQLGISYNYVSRQPHNSQILSYKDLSPDAVKDHRLIINCTPLGMFPHVDTYPDIPYDALTSEHILFDCVYNPEETLFMRLGRKKTMRIQNGLSMLYLQAEAAWKIWND